MIKNWDLSCSKDGLFINYQTTIKSKTEPDFWTCNDIAMKHDCPFFTITEVTNY